MSSIQNEKDTMSIIQSKIDKHANTFAWYFEKNWENYEKKSNWYIHDTDDKHNRQGH